MTIENDYKKVYFLKVSFAKNYYCGCRHWRKRLVASWIESVMIDKTTVVTMMIIPSVVIGKKNLVVNWTESMLMIMIMRLMMIGTLG